MPVLLIALAGGINCPERFGNKTIGGLPFLRPGHIGLFSSRPVLLAQVASSLMPPLSLIILLRRTTNSKYIECCEAISCDADDYSCNEPHLFFIKVLVPIVAGNYRLISCIIISELFTSYNT